jgi:hypothetical protein
MKLSRIAQLGLSIIHDFMKYNMIGKANSKNPERENEQPSTGGD